MLVLKLLFGNGLLVELGEDDSGCPIVDVCRGDVNDVRRWLNRHGEDMAVLAGPERASGA